MTATAAHRPQRRDRIKRRVSEQEREPLKNKIRAILETYQGPDNCITMTDLHARATGDAIIPWRRYDQTRSTRAIVEELRFDGCPIGNKGGKNGGYFWARNDAELKSTIQWFHERAMSGLAQEAALKRVSFGELLKQYQLEFEAYF